jgi:hypothetical protein
VALAAATAVLGAGAHSASAAPAATTTATNTCWQEVVNDWLHHNGQIKNTYAVPCYTQALQHLNAYADIKGYSNIIDDIHRALLAAIHQDRGGGPPTSGPSSSNGPSNNGPGNTSTGTASHDRGWVQSIANRLGPGNANSIPLPLVVLGALALLLLLAAIGTWLARRIQTRRVTPAPAPAPLPRNRP